MSDGNDDLRSRMADIEGQVASSSKRGSTGKMLGVAAAALIVGVGGYALVASVSQPVEQPATMQSNGVQEFPEDRPAEETLAMPAPPEPMFVERQVITTQTDSATLARLADLEAELEDARALAAAKEDETEQERLLREELERERDRFAADIAALRSTAQNDQDRAREITEQLQADLASLRTQIGENERALLNAQTQAQRDLLEQQGIFEQQLREARAVDPLEQDRFRAEMLQAEQEARDRERLEAARAERAAANQQRAESGLIAVNNTGAQEAGSAGSRTLSDAESFVRRGVEPVAVARASQITAPQATVPQGTIIQASLETAVDSTLPGPIRGVVAEDVHSMDGSAVLIPAGSKVFGEYSSGIQLGQKRILIVWTRVLTPSNRSISIASYGADQLGRSGTGGAVDTRFAARFGGAAAISIIGAAPQIAAREAERENALTIAENVGDDLSSATDSAIGAYINIPPTIYVRQGTSVSIIVDRDLEIF